MGNKSLWAGRILSGIIGALMLFVGLSAIFVRTPAQVAYDCLLADDGEAMLYFPSFNYAYHDLSQLHAQLPRRLHERRAGGVLVDPGLEAAVEPGARPQFVEEVVPGALVFRVVDANAVVHQLEEVLVAGHHGHDGADPSLG